MIITIQRGNLDLATMGKLSVDGSHHSDTLELPWNGNRKRESCIPPGAYPLTFKESPRFKRPMLTVGSVPGRDGILIHAANHVSELRGCISLGLRSATNPEYLMDSRRYVQRLEAMVLLAMDRKETVTLEILNPKGAV
jgi:hypothetical protein